MEVPTYTLYVKPHEGDPVKLRLSADPTEFVEPRPDAPSIDADAKVMFVLRGFSGGRLTATIAIAGAGIIPCYTEHVNGDLFLYPEDDRPPFSPVIGHARITLHVSSGSLRVRLTAEPLEVLLRPGLSADNLTAMAAAVRKETALLYGGNEFAARRLRGLGERVELMKEIAGLYDRQYPYFRENARYQLTGRPRTDAIERIRTLASGAAGWLMTHAHELERVRDGSGLRAKGRTWLPRHAPTVAVEQNRDIPENRAVAGFPLTLGRAAGELLKLIENENAERQKKRDGMRSSDFMPCASPAETEELRQAVSVFSRLGTIYRDALCGDAAPLTGVPRPTAHFIATSQYRLMYEAMRRWFSLPPLDLAAVRRELNALTGARLFEYYTLVRLLQGAEAAGFELRSSKRHEYSLADRLYAQAAGAPVDNTFVFERNEERLTIWYQPLIGGKRSAGENGLKLYRATTLAFKPLAGEPVDTLRDSTAGYYTPDFVIALEKNGKTVWATADAKYSTAAKVRKSGVASLAFRYLVSLRCLEPADIYVGLWLWCGYAIPNEGTEPLGSVFDVTEAMGAVPEPDLFIAKLTALSGEGNPIEPLLQRLQIFAG